VRLTSRATCRPPDQKEAVFAEDLMRMVETLDHGLRGLRDRAILLIGFAGGLRRSEITGLDCGPDQTEEGGWIEFLDQGVIIRVRGKTGWREVEIGRGSSDPTCPVALQTWLKLGRIAHGPLFRRIARGGKDCGDAGCRS
jgi:site-specific recombinase XerC